MSPPKRPDTEGAQVNREVMKFCLAFGLRFSARGLRAKIAEHEAPE